MQFFDAQGLLAHRFPQHEVRSGQLEMALAVWDAFTGVGHTAIQAGTGLGKTFAYLVPAALYAVEMKHRIVISTGTLNLQHQIISKDIPMLQQILAGKLDFQAALVKGRNNYLCKRKLTAFAYANMQQVLFNQPGDHEQWVQISEMFYDKHFVVGDRDEIPFQVAPSLWSDLGAEADLCLRNKCPFFSECYFYQARNLQRQAQLLVTNHALFFADLAIRNENLGSPSSDSDSVLYSYDGVVFDEAQSIEDIATNHFTARVSYDRLAFLAREVASALRPGGMLQWEDEQDFMRIDSMFGALLPQAETMLYQLSNQYRDQRTVRFREPDLYEDLLSDFLRDIEAELSSLTKVAQNDEQVQVISALAQRAGKCAYDMRLIHDMPSGDDYAYWLDSGDRQIRQIKLEASPVSIAEIMQEALFEQVPVVLTSATLASELVRRIGLDTPTWMRLDSPFNYERHARLYLPEDAPEASQGNELRFMDFVCQRVPELTEISRGRAFILFTSYRSMQDCYQRCLDVLQQQGWEVMIQGEKRRDVLLAEFIQSGKAVLFAVNSFWEGVDVPGDALSLVVLVKLPFSVPSEPIQQARMEALQREGKDPFQDYTLPQAILRLKQGFGRLIRSKQDTGVIAILDKRILSKSYGKRFLRDLPPAPRLQKISDVQAFYAVLDQALEAQKRGQDFVWPKPPAPPPSATSSGRRTADRPRQAYTPSAVPPADAQLSDEQGWWLPDDMPAPSKRRPDPDEIVFYDIAPERGERSSDLGRSVRSMRPEEVIFDDIPRARPPVAPARQRKGSAPSPSHARKAEASHERVLRSVPSEEIVFDDIREDDDDFPL